MSCNGCRVLRKGCNESCVLRHCLVWINSPAAQGHATMFLTRYFGRASLMSFVSDVSEVQRPALFRSLLHEACGRTLNPVDGVIGLVWTGNWHLCQMAVETVLRGGTVQPITLPVMNFGAKKIKEERTDQLLATKFMDCEEEHTTLSYDGNEPSPDDFEEPKLLNLFV